MDYKIIAEIGSILFEYSIVFALVCFGVSLILDSIAKLKNKK